MKWAQWDPDFGIWSKAKFLIQQPCGEYWLPTYAATPDATSWVVNTDDFQAPEAGRPDPVSQSALQVQPDP
ncbi:MAG: hypothetical protein OXR73_02650 [Myxococcales bacterium]|nr:hypothetical protein [Myxococcales bacterium]